jgi:hypothetical protein
MSLAKAEREVVQRLVERLHTLRDHGYQPMYNGRPSCPFCSNFIDDEETHSSDCILLGSGLAIVDLIAEDAL